MKFFYIVIAFFLLTKFLLADDNIIKEGKILKSKPNSLNETTLVVNNSNKIYICSVVDRLTKCILSNTLDTIN